MVSITIHSKLVGIPPAMKEDNFVVERKYYISEIIMPFLRFSRLSLFNKQFFHYQNSVPGSTPCLFSPIPKIRTLNVLFASLKKF